MTFTHLHNHSDHSVLDGAIRFDRLATRLKAVGQTTVALTDHGSLSGSYAFQAEMVKQGIKPIIGLEAYVAPSDASLKEPYYYGTEDQRRHDVSRGAYTHISLLAMNDEGIQELYKLQSRAFREGYYYKPRMDVAWIMEAQNLIVLSGCAGSELSTRVRLDQMDAAEAYVRGMKFALGDRFYIEVMDHGITDTGLDGFDEGALGLRLKSLAAAHDIRVVPTNDAHYSTQAEAGTHDALLCVQTRSKLADENRFRFTGEGFYIKSREEMAELFSQEELDNTLEIAERVQNYTSAFKKVVRMPKVDGVGTLRELVYASDRLPPFETAETTERIESELAVIEPAGFEGYFLVLADVINWCKSNGIAVGPGRGSAGGSYVCYLVGITDLNPLDHDLLFERFLNPSRVSLPDIDVDVDDTERDRVLAYIRSKHGEENVAQILTLGTIGAKAALKDAVRVLGHPFSMGTELVGSLPPPLFGRQPTLAELPPVEGPDRRAVVNLARGFEGLIRNTGVHAAGVVVSPVPVSQVIPVQWDKDDPSIQITGVDAGPVESMGLVKMDFLGLRNLGILQRTLSRVGMDWAFMLQLPLDDSATYQLLSSGQTDGVFQLDSEGMQRLLRDVQPNCFEDISAVLALYRPGPMGVRAHHEYAKRKRSGSGSLGIDYNLDRDLAPILDETYGLFVYQEQIMRALQVAGGYTLGEADLVRKAMGKKDRALLATLKPEFLSRIAGNYDRESADAFWAIVEPFADYSFNKAHTVGYGLVSYWTAYCKVHYPREYMAEVLSSVADDPDKLPGYMAEVARMGIKLLPPDVNESEASYTPSKDGIRVGLAGVKGFGEKAFERLQEGRPFVDLNDFYGRADRALLNIGTLRALVRSGAFDTMEPRRALHDEHSEHLAQRATDRRTKARTLLMRAFELPKLDELIQAKEQYIVWESELLGIALTSEQLVLLPKRKLTQQEWEWTADLIAAYPGPDEVLVDIEGKLVDTGYKVDRVAVREKLADVVNQWFY